MVGGRRTKLFAPFPQAGRAGGRALPHTAKPSQRPVRLLVLFTAFSQVRGVTRRASHELTSSSLSPFISPSHYPTTLFNSTQYGFNGRWLNRQGAWCFGWAPWATFAPYLFRIIIQWRFSELRVIAPLASCLRWLAGKRSSLPSDWGICCSMRGVEHSPGTRCPGPNLHLDVVLSVHLRLEADTLLPFTLPDSHIAELPWRRVEPASSCHLHLPCLALTRYVVVDTVARRSAWN